MAVEFRTSLLLRELQYQCAEAIEAINKLNSYLASKDSSVGQIMGSIDDFADHAARAAVILWPVQKFRNEAATTLRAELKIAEDHPLQDKNLRNRLQHFDEQLQKWVDANPNGNVADYIVGPANIVEGATQFRRYDPETKTYHFLGEAYDIQAQVQAVVDILERATALIGRR